MLVDARNNVGQSSPANVGLAAFLVAVVQQKEFEETIERFTDKQQAVVDDRQRKVEATRERVARERGGVDVVVSESTDESGQAQQASEARGASVDLEV